MKSFIILFSILLLFACQPITPAGTGRTVSGIDSLAQAYFEHYKSRADWEGFLDLYDEDLFFQDVILRMDLEGKKAFSEFYNWPDTGLVKHPDYPEVLVLENLSTTDSTATGFGYFTPFYYQEVLYEDWEHMRFCIQLTFNNQGKIIRQIDFIEYPPSILKAVVERLLKYDKDYAPDS